MFPLYIAFGLIIFGVVIYANLFNGLVQVRQKVKESWSGIDVQLKRRYDLVPNLVETVKGYAKHEQETLDSVIKARNIAVEIPDGEVSAQAGAENMLSGALKSIFALSENYPDLKANQNFLELQRELTHTEDQIASSRQIYNGNVTMLNIKVQSFPSNMVANMHSFHEAEFFEIEESEKVSVQKAPNVKF